MFMKNWKKLDGNLTLEQLRDYLNGIFNTREYMPIIITSKISTTDDFFEYSPISDGDIQDYLDQPEFYEVKANPLQILRAKAQYKEYRQELLKEKTNESTTSK